MSRTRERLLRVDREARCRAHHSGERGPADLACLQHDRVAGPAHRAGPERTDRLLGGRPGGLRDRGRRDRGLRRRRRGVRRRGRRVRLAQAREALPAPLGVTADERAAVRAGGRHSRPEGTPVPTAGNKLGRSRPPRSARPRAAPRSVATWSAARAPGRRAHGRRPRAGRRAGGDGVGIRRALEIRPPRSRSHRRPAIRARPESPTTTGRPHAAASMNTLPHPSTSSPPRRVRHGIANTSPSA